MADGIVTDYDTLVARVKVWVARSDTTFSNQFPIIVSLAENRIYNGHGKDPNEPLYSAPLRSNSYKCGASATVFRSLHSTPARIQLRLFLMPCKPPKRVALTC